jgi:tetratricopeptide (TPR) repeat protein
MSTGFDYSLNKILNIQQQTKKGDNMKPSISKKTGYTACIVLVFLLIAAIPVSAAENDTPIMMSGQNIDAINAYNNGSDLASQGKFQDALVETEKALSIQPNFTLALTQKAGILNVMGRYQEALDATNAAIAGNANISEAWVNRADALVHLGKYQDAIDSANRALAIDPTLEPAKTTKLLATKLLGNSASASPVPTTKAPASLIPVIGALAVAGCVAGYRKYRN